MSVSEAEVRAAAEQIHHELGCTITAAERAAALALTAAASARWRPIEVVELQPDADCPGLWIGFRTAEQREQAMKLFALPSPPETER